MTINKGNCHKILDSSCYKDHIHALTDLLLRKKTKTKVV